MNVAFVVYDGFTALDLIGPYEVIAGWPDIELAFVASSPGLVSADSGLTVAAAPLRDADLVVVPGSSRPLGPLSDPALREWVQGVSATWMASVCTGAAVYAAAGLLTGRRATTHWAFRETLAGMGVEVVPERVVFDPPFVSAAGVSAGIDMALALTERVHGADLARAIQLAIEYDPQPPFSAGTPEAAGPELTAVVRERLRRAASGSASPRGVGAPS
jgi:transcriptional regulator GlxA family with amidase domain